MSYFHSPLTEKQIRAEIAQLEQKGRDGELTVSEARVLTALRRNLQEIQMAKNASRSTLRL